MNYMPVDLLLPNLGAPDLVKQQNIAANSSTSITASGDNVIGFAAVIEFRYNDTSGRFYAAVSDTINNTSAVVNYTSNGYDHVLGSSKNTSYNTISNNDKTLTILNPNSVSVRAIALVWYLPVTL